MMSTMLDARQVLRKRVTLDSTPALALAGSLPLNQKDDYGLLSKKTKNTFEVKSTHATATSTPVCPFAQELTCALLWK